MANKKNFELDARVIQIIDEEFAEYERYLPTIQDVAQYRRKRKEYWTKINARIREELNDGRTDDAGTVAADTRD
ncbi:MAG: hypothetical protein IJS42_03635 [Synergistaceae bacterium]|nr:hypothetical protein [Synergistaceae bacterium]